MKTFNYNQIARRVSSSLLLGTITVGQILPVAPIANFALEQTASAQTTTGTSANGSAQAQKAINMVNYCWNNFYVKRPQVYSMGFQDKQTEQLNSLINGLRVVSTSFYYGHCGVSGQGQGEEFARAARSRIEFLFDKYASSPLYKAAFKVYRNETVAKQMVTLWRQAVSVNAFVPAFVTNDTSKVSIARAEKAYPLILNLGKANLQLQAQVYKANLKFYEKYANENGLNNLYYAGEALYRDYNARNHTFLFLPTENIGGAGSFPNPSIQFEASPIDFMPVVNNNYQNGYKARLTRDLKNHKYKTIVPDLFEQVNKSILYLQQVKGLDRLNSFNYLMAELGLDLLLGVTDVPMSKTRSYLSAIPDTELRSAAKKTSNPKRANALVDDIKKTGRTSSRSSGSVADDAKKPNRNNSSADDARRSSLECVAYNPDTDKAEFSLALAQSVNKSKSLIAKVLEESGAKVVSDAPIGGSEFAPEFSGQLEFVAYSSCLGEVRRGDRFKDTPKNHDFTGSYRDIQGNPVWDYNKNRWFNHAEEMKGYYNGVRKDIRAIDNEFKNNSSLTAAEKDWLKNRKRFLQKISDRIYREVGSVERIDSAAKYIQSLNDELVKSGVTDYNTARKMLIRSNRLRK